MKKDRFLKAALLVAGLSGLLACDKKEDEIEPKPEPVTTEIKKGFPENRRSIHGYLYACSSGGTTNPQLSVNAFFGDPARDLLGVFDHQNEQNIFSGGTGFPNVTVGNLYANGYLVNTSKNTTFYNRVFSLSGLPSSVNWKSDGNKSFFAMDLNIPGQFPSVNQAALNSYSVISRSKELVLNFSNFISECDSVAVTFGYGGISSQYLRKCVRYSDGQIRFSSAELSNLSYSSIMVSYSGFSYWSKVTNNKTFVFELSGKANMYTMLTN
ncbi:MAG: hypothetical protein JNL60_17440 [Bacteroidia bacterium]|nr:hypothetical protein [Bacteroidia bacterium]